MRRHLQGLFVSEGVKESPDPSADSTRHKLTEGEHWTADVGIPCRGGTMVWGFLKGRKIQRDGQNNKRKDVFNNGLGVR